jgi:2'-hydroxyisoflavone reductase
LIFGGTGFLSRRLVEDALTRGYDVTTFSRGVSGHPPAGVTWIRGDRVIARDLGRLEKHHRFDAVVDVCQQSPNQVRAAAKLLDQRTERYVFVSSTSVYKDFSKPGLTEAAPLRTLPAGGDEESGDYGALKARSEQIVQQTFGDRALIVRPCLLAGQNDTSDRFGYWPCRLSRGGEVLAPGRPGRPIQFIDVKDVSSWVLRAVDSGYSGVFNVRGPDPQATMSDLLTACISATGTKASLTWIEDSFLESCRVVPYVDLPVWLPEGPETAGFALVSAQKAAAAGLRCRPMADTIRDSWTFERSVGLDRKRRAGLSPHREAQILDAWHASRRRPEVGLPSR